MLTLLIRATMSLYAITRFAPTNLLLGWLRTRRGLKWGLPFMSLGVLYLAGAATCATLITNGGPGWLNILVILGIWNGLRFIWFGPYSLLLLTRYRLRESRQQKRAAQSADEIVIAELIEEADAPAHPEMATTEWGIEEREAHTSARPARR